MFDCRPAVEIQLLMLVDRQVIGINQFLINS
ncbi:hypothetical protein BX265_4862 [Streptomyces sp. TLI_235]|nr:hypothetical protein BX265_4862 [Streptomyces sp. TLI_235]